MGISLVGKDKAIVLAALYNASTPQGLGFMAYDPAPMTRDEAAALLGKDPYFDYLKGRVMKVDLKGDDLDPSGYDRDNGPGAAARAIEAAFAADSVNPPSIDEAHRLGTVEAATQAREMMGQPTTVEHQGGAAVMHMGLANVAAPLSEAMRKVGH